MNIIKSDVKSLPANYSFLVITNILISLLSIFITSMLTHMLTTASYGVYGIFIFVTQTLLLFSSTWIINSIVRFGREEFDKSENIASTFWAYSLIAGIMFVVGTAFILIIKNKVTNYIGIPNQAIWILLIYVFFLLISASLLNTCQATRRIKLFGILQVVEKTVFLLILSLFYVFYRRLSVELLLYSLLLSSGIFVLINIVIANKKILIPIKIDKQHLRELLVFSSPLFISCGMAHFGMWTSPLMINYFLAKDQLGTYYLAHQINFLVGSTILQLSIALTPVLVLMYAREKFDLISLYIRKLVPLCVLVWALIIALTMLVFKFVFLKIFGQHFKFAVMPMEILLLGTGFAAIHVLLAGVLTAYKLTWALTRAAIIYILTNLVGNIILIKDFGILGAAVASCAASLAYSFAILLETHRKIEFRMWPVISTAIPVLIGFMIFILVKGIIFTLIISSIVFAGLVLFIKRIFFNPDLIYILNKLEISNGVVNWVKRKAVNL